MPRVIEQIIGVIGLVMVGFSCGAAVAVGNWDTWLSRVPWSIVTFLIFMMLFFGRSKPKDTK